MYISCSACLQLNGLRSPTTSRPSKNGSILKRCASSRHSWFISWCISPCVSVSRHKTMSSFAVEQTTPTEEPSMFHMSHCARLARSASGSVGTTRWRRQGNSKGEVDFKLPCCKQGCPTLTQHIQRASSDAAMHDHFSTKNGVQTQCFEIQNILRNSRREIEISLTSALLVYAGALLPFDGAPSRNPSQSHVSSPYSICECCELNKHSSKSAYHRVQTLQLIYIASRERHSRQQRSALTLGRLAISPGVPLIDLLES
jgi:hypothetical protein